MDLQVELEGELKAMAGSLMWSIIFHGNPELTDLQSEFLGGILGIMTLSNSDITDSESESELIPLITQWISFLPSMDLDPQFEPVLELKSLIAKKISIDQLKREIISPICHIYSVVISTKSKWERKPKKLTCLCPQVQLTFENGKFRVSRKVEWNSTSNGACWYNQHEEATYFFCSNCNGKYHEEYEKAPVEIKHHLHPRHHLQLATWSWLNRSRECYCCDEDLLSVFYYCSACDFAMNVACVEKPPLLLAIDHPKRHEHTLALFTRQTPLTCNLCAITDLSSPIYMCPPCGFVVHMRCIKLPRIIKISRHPHRISFTSPFDEGDWSCGVCRRKIDNDYGGYSCFKKGCSYAAHSKCATQSNVWDGKELEGEPEEVEEEDVEPFVRISDGIIQHFSHHDHLKLDENTGGDYDDNKECQACIMPIYSGKFYSCMQCDFVLHEACANLSRKIHHPIHPHQLVLVRECDDVTNDCGICSACPSYCTGFSYKCSKEGCHFKVHVQCATISEPLVHESHMHPLFLTSKPGERRTCSVCKYHLYTERETFNCIECDLFSLCFACATLPQKVRYKYDKHMLTLSNGEETSTMTSWCEACERKIDPKDRFYMCDEYCCVNLHIECLFGRTFYMKPDSSIRYSGRRLDIVRNNHMSRPICVRCKMRCQERIYFCRSGSIICSMHCLGLG